MQDHGAHVLLSDSRDASSPAPSPTELFNGYVGAGVAFALEQNGVLDVLRQRGSVSHEELSRLTSTRPDRLRTLIDAAVRLRLIDRRSDCLSLTASGLELARHVGYFVWVVGGCGGVVGSLGDWARGERQFGVDIHRDMVQVAAGSARCDEAFMAPILRQVLDHLDFRCVADLGCGDATRLVRICDRYPATLGLGVEISPDACRVARERVAEAGMGGRVHVWQGDATDFAAERELREQVDLVCSFLLLHDLFAAMSPPEALFARLRETFPNARRYLFADTNAMPWDGREPAIFTVGFELVHGVMDVPLRTVEEYEQIIARSGLVLERRLPFGVPNTWLYVLAAE
jgi:hypothetical protein